MLYYHPFIRQAFKSGRRVHFALRRKMRKPPIACPPARDGLHLWSKSQVNFDKALTDFNSRQFKTWAKKIAALVNCCLFSNAFSIWLTIQCLEIGTFVLIKVLLTVDRLVLVTSGKDVLRSISYDLRNRNKVPTSFTELFFWRPNNGRVKKDNLKLASHMYQKILFTGNKTLTAKICLPLE